MTTAAELRNQALAAQATASEAGDRAKELLAQARKIEREERQAEEKRRADASYAETREIGNDYGFTDQQHGIVYSLAYEDGHSGGYGEVRELYGKYADFAKSLLDTK
jgi:hypothetical protein